MPASPTSPRRRGPQQPGPWTRFGQRLAERRRELGLTQRELADLADVSFSTVQALEAGRTATKVESLHRILRVLGWALVALPLREARRSAGALLLPADGPEDEHD
jgi:transcriptional regulator with XRE-family HTH domain